MTKRKTLRSQVGLSMSVRAKMISNRFGIHINAYYLKKIYKEFKITK